MTMELVHEVAQFLYHEARLLDTNDYLAWADLFGPEAVYRVPPTNEPEADSDRALYLINDDRFRITERAKRLTKKGAHAEFPPSRLCRAISNVTAKVESGDLVRAGSNFVAYRYRNSRMDIYPGHSEYLLRRQGDTFVIESKVSTLALDSLRPHGKLSIII